MGKVKHRRRLCGRRASVVSLFVTVLVSVSAGVYCLGQKKFESPRTYSAEAGVWYTWPKGTGSGGGSIATLLPDVTAAQRQITSAANLEQALRAVAAGTPNRPPQAPLSQEQAAVRDGLRVTAQGDARGWRVGIALRGRDLSQVLRLTNRLAEQYAAAERSRLETMLTKQYQQAHQAAEQARDGLRRASARVDEARRALEAAAGQPATSPSPPEVSRRPSPPPMVENPQWLDLDKQVKQLDRRRWELLVDRTPIHPEVQHVDAQIAQLREMLTNVPRWLPAPSGHGVGRNEMASQSPLHQGQASAEQVKPVAPTSLPGPAPEARAAEQLAAARAAEVQARQNADRLAQLERRAWQQRQACPLVRVQPADRCQVFGETRGRSLPLVLFAGSLGLAMALGVALVALAVGRDPKLRTLAQLQAAIPVPVVGVVKLPPTPTSAKPDRPAGSFPRLASGIVGAALIAVSVAILALTATRV